MIELSYSFKDNVTVYIYQTLTVLSILCKVKARVTHTVVTTEVIYTSMFTPMAVSFTLIHIYRCQAEMLIYKVKCQKNISIDLTFRCMFIVV